MKAAPIPFQARRTHPAGLRGVTARAALLLAALLVLFAPAGAQVLPSELEGAAPKVIIYYTNAATIRQVFAEDRPNLQHMLRESGVAVMVTGPTDTDPFISLAAGRYVPNDEAGAAPPPALPPGVVPFIEPGGDPATGDRILGSLRERYPDVPIVAVHPGRWRPPGVERIPPSLSLPSWIAISGTHGRLYSDTTRRAGIVSNLDVAPTLYRMATGERGGPWPGHAIWGGPKVVSFGDTLPHNVQDAVRLQDALYVLALVTNPTAFVVGAGGILLLLAAALLLWPRPGRPPRWQRTARRGLPYALTALLLAPVGVAVASGMRPHGTEEYAVMALGATAALLAFSALGGYLLATSREDRTAAMLQMATGTMVAYIAVEVLRHGLALKLSPLSNFYVTGVRFYGVGNEYAALLLAGSVVAAFLTVQRSGTEALDGLSLLALGAWMAAMCVVIGWPAWGANFGGLLTGCVTGGLAWMLAARRSGLRWAWVLPTAVSVALVAGIVAWDARSTNATHMGRFVQSASEGAGGPLAILREKASISLRLMTARPALAIYMVAVGFLILAAGPLAPAIREARGRWPWAMLAVPTVLFGGLFGAAANDTGIVMLGLMAVTGLGAVAALALEPKGLKVM